MITPKYDIEKTSEHERKAQDKDVMAASGGETPGRESGDLDLECSDLIHLGATGWLEEYSAAADYLSCEKHPGERMAAYCDTCETSVCFKCWTDPKHVSHDGISFKEWREKSQSVGDITGLNEPIVQHARAKQAKLMKLKVDVKLGHKQEEEAAKATARVVLTSLQLNFDREVQVLEDALKEQTGHVKQLLRDQLGKIHTSLDEQLRRIQEAEKKIDDAVDGLQKPTLDAQSSESEAPQMQEVPGQSRKVTEVNEAVAEVKTVRVVSNKLKTEDFTPLDNFPAKVIANSGSDDSYSVASTSSLTGTGLPVSPAGACPVIPADRVMFLRSRIDLFTLDCVTSSGSFAKGNVVITREYHISCREYAKGRTAVFPGPLQCPDLWKPCSLYDDVTFIPPDDATALCQLVGGTPDVTVGDQSSWLLGSTFAFRYTRLYDEQGKAIEISGKGSNANFCNLPVIETFHNAIEKYAGFYPSIVKEKITGRVIENTVTVGSWKPGCDNVILIVIK